MARGDIHDFLKALFASEGGGNISVENKYGYIGKYQFGESALQEIGYYVPAPGETPIHNKHFQYRWEGSWTGQDGASSKKVFLASEDIQDQAAMRWVSLLCKQLHRFKLDKYFGKTVGGVDVTESGVIAAAHLKGYGNKKHPGVIAFLRSDGKIDASDANGTTVSSYMKEFAGYELGCCGKCAVVAVDGDHNPIQGLMIKVMSASRELYSGLTNEFGSGKIFSGFKAGEALHVLVQRMEGGFKEITSFSAKQAPQTLTLVSPKSKHEMELKKHVGQKGGHKKTRVKPASAAAKQEERGHGDDRTDQGHPVLVPKPSIPQPLSGDPIKKFQEILVNNARYGSKKESLSGIVAVKKSKNGEAISSFEKYPNTSLGRCYKYVKIALQASGLVDVYLGGEAAKDAGKYLEKYGFVNVLNDASYGIASPHDAPEGSIIVYDVMDGSKYGHIEARVEANGTLMFCSDYLSPRSRVELPGGQKTLVGRGRKVIGVWVRK